MKNYLKQVAPSNTTTADPLPGRDMAKNNSGGYVFEVEDFERMKRFLILGSEGGSYYVGQRDLTRQNVDCILRALDNDFRKALDTIVDISTSGRSPSNDPAIFALALASSYGLNGMGSPESAKDAERHRNRAYARVSKVCRTSTHLFSYLSYCKMFRGMGSGLRKAIADWYLSKDLNKLAYQAIKYRQRDGWSHRDVLRLVRPKAWRTGRNNLFKWIVGKGNSSDELPRIIRGFEMANAPLSSIAKRNGEGAFIAALINEYGLPREAVPTNFLKDPAVWDALLERMPMMAMVRNLGNMSKVGLLTMGSDASQRVVDRLHNVEMIRKSRIHPIQLLMALTTYSSGQGYRGKGNWTPVAQIIDALDDAFITAFDNVIPSGKRIMLAIDCSPSMTSFISGQGITARQGAAAMAMATARTEKHYHTYGFAGNWHNSDLTKLRITARQRLDDAIGVVEEVNWGGTDCSLPMRHAQKHRMKVDAFVIYTDNETNSNMVHPCIALRDYRSAMGIDAKLVVCGMTSTGFSIADPGDSDTMDVIGFDSSAPAIISDFIRGEF